MDSIINETLESEDENNKTSNVGMSDEEIAEIAKSLETEISVIGCGGAGCNTVNRIAEEGIDNAELVAVNTDAQDLNNCDADTKLLVGKETCRGHGAGSDPEKGEVAARENVEEIEKLVEGKDMVFITAGMGGGTGTGVAPVVAGVAKNKALTVSVVTTPFKAEGKKRVENAKEGMKKLRKNSDTVLFISNDSLIENVPNLPMEKAFKMADTVLMRCVTEIVDIIKKHNLVNLDFADVRAVMEDGGLGMIGLGESDNSNDEECLSKALDSPLLDVDISEANNVLVNITGGSDMQVEKSQKIVKSVQNQVDNNARIIWGAGTYDELDGKIRTMVIITGVDKSTNNTDEQDSDQVQKEFESEVDDGNTNNKQNLDNKTDSDIIKPEPSTNDDTKNNETDPQTKRNTKDSSNEVENSSEDDESTIDFVE